MVFMAGHDGYTRYTTRIPDALYQRIKDAAGVKSVNAEIVATLEEKYPPTDPLSAKLLSLFEELEPEEREFILSAARAQQSARKIDEQ